MATASSIGERIKGLRMEEGITLVELGERVNLSASYLSQIERDKTSPSLSTLMSIAKALNVGLRYFFEVETEAAHLVRAHDGREGEGPRGSATRECLTPEVGNPSIQVQRITLPPRAPAEELALRAGEELVFVLSGELTITIGEEEFLLASGDSIHYDALSPHCWENKGNESCTLIWSHAGSRTERPS